MARAPVSTVTEVRWGRVTAVAGGAVVAYGLARGTARVVRIATNEVKYRIGGAGDWGRPGRRT